MARTSKYVGFCFTVNGYTDQDLTRCRNLVGQRGISYLIFGKEIGTRTGNLHLQGYLQTNQDKFDRMRLALPEGAHIEKQKATSREARDYCKKDGEYEEFGQYRHIGSVGQGTRTDLDRVKQMIYEGKSYDEITQSEFGTVCKHYRFIEKCCQEQDLKKRVASLRARLESAVLRPWQQALLDFVNEEPDARRIHWLWEPQGNTGKSWMKTYLVALHGAIAFDSGKVTDMAHIWSKKQSKTVIFDLSRTQEGFLNGVYSFAEQLKNGVVTSTKYDGQMIISDIPHVIVFANFEPDRTKWSDDRYFIVKIH